MPRKPKIYLVLDNIRSRENVGSIFRTADAADVSKIYLCGITPKPPHPKISKVSLGAETFVPWESYKDTWRLLKELSGKDINVIGLEQAKGAKDIFDYKPDFPIALVVGNEVRGLSPKILKYCDKKIFIPMNGRKESLNVSVAAGVALYQLIK